MTSADLVSLFQLATALNLGFGALVTFGEPFKQSMRREIVKDEAMLEQLIEQKNYSKHDIDTVFEISRLYLNLRSAYHDINRQLEFLDWPVVNIAIIAFALISFIGLSLCSAYASGDAHYGFFVVALMCNICPLVIALTHFILALQLKSNVYPRLLQFQIAIRAASIRTNKFVSKPAVQT